MQNNPQDQVLTHEPILKNIINYTNSQDHLSLRLINKDFHKAEDGSFIQHPILLKRILLNLGVSKLFDLDEKNKKQISQALFKQQHEFFYPFQKEWLQKASEIIDSTKNLDVSIETWLKRPDLPLDDKLNAIFFKATQKNKNLTMSGDFFDLLTHDCNERKLKILACLSPILQPEQINIIVPILFQTLNADAYADNSTTFDAALLVIESLAQKFSATQISQIFNKLIGIFNEIEPNAKLSQAILILTPRLNTEQLFLVYRIMEHELVER